MTNKEKYKQAFSALHISDDFSLEGNRMKEIKKSRRLPTMIASVAACVMLVGSVTTAYAMDVGGIQRRVQLWINGDQTDATIQLDGNGGYIIHFIDKDGEEQQQSGGGVAFDPDGTERPVSEEELLEHLSDPEVLYHEDGSVWVTWFDQKIDITDRFQDDICYVKLVRQDKTLYLTVKYQNGYAASPNKYVEPSEFNCELDG